MARNQTVVGLDIGRHAAKAAWVGYRGGKAYVTRIEQVRLPSERSMTGNVLGPWIQKMGIQKYPCVIGIPGAQCLFHPFMLVEGDPRTIEQVSSMEVVRFNEMAQDTMQFGMTPFSIVPGERRAMLGMARPAIIEDAIGTARGYGLNVIDAVPTPIALFNFVESQVPDHAVPAAYVNIGQSATEIAIGLKSGPIFARSFACGGQMFTDAVATAARLPSSQAENLKVADGSLARSDNLTPALAKTTETWLAEFAACMSMFQTLYPGKKVEPSHLHISGGGSELKGLAEYLGAKLKMPVSTVSSLPGLSTGEHIPAFAAAAGLALSGLDVAISKMSLLPPDVRDELTFKRQKPYWVAAGVAAALILAVSLGGGYVDFQRREKVLSAQKQSLSKRQAIRDEIENVKAVGSKAHVMAAPICDLMGTASLMSRFMDALMNSLSKGDWVQLVCDSESYFSREDLPVPEDAKMSRDPRPNRPRPVSIKAQDRLKCIIIEGHTRVSNFSTVKKLIANLRKADFVAAADLLSDDKLLDLPRVEEVPGAKRFVIEVRLK